jgi:hypothetical protein
MSSGRKETGFSLGLRYSLGRAVRQQSRSHPYYYYDYYYAHPVLLPTFPVTRLTGTCGERKKKESRSAHVTLSKIAITVQFSACRAVPEEGGGGNTQPELLLL